MVEIKHIEQPVADLYKKSEDGMDAYIGVIENYAQYLDVRAQIKEAQENGYYLLMYDGEKITFDRNGSEDRIPNNVYFGDVERERLFKLA